MAGRGKPARRGRKGPADGPEAPAPPGRRDLADDLAERLCAWVTPATVILCIGSDLRGDDAAGLLVARQLAGTVPWEVIDAQTVPESYLGRIVQARPDCVLVVDALNFGAPAGTIEVVEPDEIAGQGPSTHGPALEVFLEALGMMCPCRCAVVGIQPRQVQFGAAVSPPVARAAARLVRAFRRLAR